jgi:3-deoxy-D-manno-octulosonic-acid transferase
MSAAAGALKLDSPMADRLVAILENTIHSLRVKLTYLLLRLAGAALLPLLLLYAAWRCLRQPAYFQGMRERLGWLPTHIPSTKPGGIWLHAVSVGEVLSAIALLKKLRIAVPETPIFVSVTTLAGRELAETRLKGLCDGVFFAPVDMPFAVRRVLRRIAPALVINFETEIWPHRIREVKRNGAKWAQVNARISDKAWPSYEKLSWLFQAVMPQIDYLAAQSQQDGERFSRLGFVGEVRLEGNLKFDFDPAGKPVDPDLAAWLAADARPLWIAASTTGGSVDDDEAVLDAFEGMGGRVRLLIAPRKPERFEVVAGKIAERGLRFARRTALREADVLLLDSIGELAGLFGSAAVVFVGGSFNETQGHNILEPAYYGKPVVTGPNMRNFAEIHAAFLAEDAVKMVGRPEMLGEAVLAAMGDVELGARGRKVALRMRGAAERLSVAMVELLGEGVPQGRVPMSWWLTPLSLPWAWVSQRGVTARRLDVPVVSVGNVSMGGTGKTPLVIALGKELVARGKRVGILTRGYGRSSARPLVLLAGETAGRKETGDEAQLFLREKLFAVGIGADRYAVGKMMLERTPLDVVLLDDGFQHRRLHRDLDVVCVDALRPFPGWNVPPAGWLREPLSSLGRADVFVLTRLRRGVEMTGLKRMLGTQPVFGVEVVESLPELPAEGRRVAFCGLGNPGSFRQSLDRMGLADVELVVFPDHNEYGKADVELLGQKGEVWITTAKDAVKLEREVFVLEQRAVAPEGLVERIAGIRQ